METQINKQAFLQSLRTGRAQWEALLEQVGEDRMTQAGVSGEWSLKDIIAHITWHEREMVGVLQARALVGSDLWNLPTDERNAAIFEQNRHRPLDEVLTEAQQVYPQLLAGVEELEEQDLIDPGRFRHMPADWQPWKIIADNSYAHYHQHIPDIRNWLEGSEQRGDR